MFVNKFSSQLVPYRSTLLTEGQSSMKPPPPPPAAPTTPIMKERGDSYAQFKEQYMRIKRVDPNGRPLRPGVQLDFIHKKVRHLDTLSDTLSEFTFHTTTNYSRLDVCSLPPQPLAQPLQQYREDDVRSVATQDMLLDDEEEENVVLDTQQILELQRKLELIQPSFEQQHFVPPPPPSSHHSYRSDPKSIVSSIRDKGKEKEEEEEIERVTSPVIESVPSFHEQHDILDDIGSDWGMDDDWGQSVIEQQQEEER